MQFKDRLEYLRMEQGLSEKELSDQVRISESIIRLYERGKGHIELEHLQVIADFFNVTPKLLLGTIFPGHTAEEAINSFRAVQELTDIRKQEKAEETSRLSPSYNANERPIQADDDINTPTPELRWQSSVRAGVVAVYHSIKDEESMIDKRYIENYSPINNTITQMFGNDLNNYYYLRMQGDYMEPTLKDQGLVLVKRQMPVENNDLAVVLCRQHPARVKRISRHDNKIVLISDNQAYRAELYNIIDCIILGKVVWKTNSPVLE